MGPVRDTAERTKRDQTADRSDPVVAFKVPASTASILWVLHCGVKRSSLGRQWDAGGIGKAVPVHGGSVRVALPSQRGASPRDAASTGAKLPSCQERVLAV